MSRRLFYVAAAIAALGAATPLAAAPLGATAGAGAAADAIALDETVQYVWGGYNYCWYPNGWRGPGWYRCGFAFRRGYGWGGPMGWRGWAPGGPPPPPPPPYYGPPGGPRYYHGGPPPGGPPPGGPPGIQRGRLVPVPR